MPSHAFRDNRFAAKLDVDPGQTRLRKHVGQIFLADNHPGNHGTAPFFAHRNDRRYITPLVGPFFKPGRGIIRMRLARVRSFHREKFDAHRFAVISGHVQSLAVNNLGHVTFPRLCSQG